MLLAVAVCARKNMNVFGGLSRCRWGRRRCLHLALALEAVAAWVYGPVRGAVSPFDGRSIRLLHNVFQPVFFRPMRRNALNRAWTLAWQRLGVGLPWRKFFYSEPGRSSDARFGCAMQQVLGVGGGLKPGQNRALKSRAVSAQAMTVGAVVAIFGKGGGTRAVVAIFCKRC